MAGGCPADEALEGGVGAWLEKRTSSPRMEEIHRAIGTDRGAPSSNILFRILHPIFTSANCPSFDRARKPGPIMFLYRYTPFSPFA